MFLSFVRELLIITCFTGTWIYKKEQSCVKGKMSTISGLFDNSGRPISGPASRHALLFKVLFGKQNAGHFAPDSTPLLKSHFEGRVKLRVPSPIPLAPGSSSSTGKYLNAAVPVPSIPSNRPVPLMISLVVWEDAGFKMPNPLSTGGLL
jgi:hypothetical protein